MSTSDDKALDEYLSYINDAVMVESVRSRSVGFMVESFARSDYVQLHKSLVTLEAALPALMSNTRQAIVKAIDQMQVDYSAVIRRKLDKKVFAKHIAETQALTATVLESLKEIFQLLDDVDLRSRQTASVTQGLNLGEVLTDPAKDVIMARVESGFTPSKKQQPSLWNTFFGKSQKKTKPNWFGLTPDSLVSDVLALNRQALIRLGVNRDIVDRVLPEGGPPVKERPKPTVAGDPDPGEIPLPSEGESSSGDKKNHRRSILNTPGPALTPLPKAEPAEPEVPKTNVKPGKKTKKSPVKKEGLGDIDDLIIERWRRLAGTI